MQSHKVKEYTNHRSEIARFYDARVENLADLNARLAWTLTRPAHHHAGLVRLDAPVPDVSDPEVAMVWLYCTEEALCDFLWTIISGLSQLRPRRVLDLGCGEGGTAARFYELTERKDLTVAGITLSPKQQQIATHNCPSGQFVLGDMVSPDTLPGQQFDVVYAIESTEYLGTPGLARLMERVADWLVPSGLFIVIAGTKSPKLPHDHPVVQAFDAHYKTHLSSSDDYRHAAAKFGFKAAAEMDLAPATLPYWRARRDNPELRNSKDGSVENLISHVLENGQGEYRLWAWYRADGK
jgi:geranyl diphosphate 2-C-methyltransferase